jgi:hypothetical protein
MEHSNTRIAIPWVPLAHNSTTPSQMVLSFLYPNRDMESIGKTFAGINSTRAARENAIVRWIPLGA